MTDPTTLQDAVARIERTIAKASIDDDLALGVPVLVSDLRLILQSLNQEEPTEAMIEAGVQAINRAAYSGVLLTDAEYAEAIYRAMSIASRG